MSTNTITGGVDQAHVNHNIQTVATTRHPVEQARSIPRTKDTTIHNMQEIKRMERQGEAIPISDEQLIRAIERAIKAVQGPLTSLDFAVHQETKQIMVKVLDKETGEIIREIPPEKNLDLLAKLWEMAGILVDERR